MALSRSILALAAELDLPERPSEEELLKAAVASRALRLRLIKEHVRVTEAVERLQAGFDEDEAPEMGGGEAEDEMDAEYA